MEDYTDAYNKLQFIFLVFYFDHHQNFKYV